MSTRARIGIIGGGLMGREVASALGRWFVLESFPVKAELMAVCDLVEKQREWFRQVPTVKLVTADYREFLASAGSRCCLCRRPAQSPREDLSRCIEGGEGPACGETVRH